MFVSIPVFSQTAEPVNDQKEVYSGKIKKFKCMKNAGTYMIVGGALAVAGGAVLSSTADWNVAFNGSSNVPNSSNNDQEVELAKVIGAVISSAVGAQLIGAGVVLRVLGKHKMRVYQTKMNGLSVNFKYTPQHQGVTLTYKF